MYSTIYSLKSLTVLMMMPCIPDSRISSLRKIFCTSLKATFYYKLLLYLRRKSIFKIRKSICVFNSISFPIGINPFWWNLSAINFNFPTFINPFFRVRSILRFYVKNFFRNIITRKFKSVINNSLTYFITQFSNIIHLIKPNPPLFKELS